MKKWLIIVLIISAIILLFASFIIYALIRAVNETSDFSESLNPLDCEKIEGPFKRSTTVNCYEEIGIKLANSSICDKITDEQPYVKAKYYCKALASRDINQCDSLEILNDWRKDRCKAVLMQDSSYCDLDEESKPKYGCEVEMERYSNYI